MPPLDVAPNCPIPELTDPIWRFDKLAHLQNIISTRQLHMTRADLFEDEEECIPPDEFIRLSLRLGPFDQREIDAQVGRLAQDRQDFHLSCWQHVVEEDTWMWRKFAPEGIALLSRYELLRNAIPAWDFSQAPTPIPVRPHVGLVRYGTRHLVGQHWNLFRFVMTKRDDFKREHEFRIATWSPDPIDGKNRQWSIENDPQRRPLEILPTRQPPFIRPTVDLAAFVSEIMVSPYAPAGTREQVEGWLRDSHLAIPVRDSSFRCYRAFLIQPGEDGCIRA